MPELMPLLSMDGSPALVEYALGEGAEPVNTPKPHLHPVRSPKGVVVTDFGPEDHRWHMGLQFGIPWVGEDNFWGGGSFLDQEQGYVVIPNQGAIRQDVISSFEPGPDGAHLETRLAWVSRDAVTVLQERRRVEVGITQDILVIDHDSELVNVTDAVLTLGTPRQRGRADGGYGGLFLRLALDFEVVDARTESGPAEASGHPGRTFIVQGRAGGRDLTLGLADLPGTQMETTRWLYRFEPFPAIGWSVMYDEGASLPPAATLRFAHRLVVADGLRSPEEISAVLLG